MFDDRKIPFMKLASGTVTHNVALSCVVVNRISTAKALEGTVSTAWHGFDA